MVVFDRTNPPEQVQFKKLLGDALTKPGVLITSIFAVLQLFVTSSSARHTHRRYCRSRLNSGTEQKGGAE